MPRSRLLPVLGLLLAGALLAGPARAQDWQDYRYPDQGFAFAAPIAPTVESKAGSTPSGLPAPVRTYRSQSDGMVYTLSIFDLSKAKVDAASVIPDTEKALAATGHVSVAVDARINRQFGRELTLDASDGGRQTVALFYVGQQLYELMAKALPPNPDAHGAQAIRFQQSLQFLGQDGQGGGGFGGRGRFGPGGGGGRGGGQAAQAACAGKAAGDKVSLQTPGGLAPATCVLVARPDAPPQ